MHCLDYIHRSGISAVFKKWWLMSLCGILSLGFLSLGFLLLEYSLSMKL